MSALSAIQDDLHVSPTGLVCIPSAYTLVVASLVMSAGTIGNLYGRKHAFVTGAAIMITGSLIVYAAGSAGGVIVGQFVSGPGGALILPNSLAILGATFPDPHRRTEVVTIWAASSDIGLAAGPLIAGTLLDHFHWNTVFLSTAVLAVVTLVAAAFVAESRGPAGKLDIPGQVLAVLGIAALVYALIEGGHDGYTSPRILIAWMTAAAALTGFVLVERAGRTPMLDITLFRSASFSAVMFVAAVSLFGFTGLAILSVLFYERVQHLSALDVGWRLLAFFGVYVIVSYTTGRVIRRTGFKLPPTLGFLIGAAATAGLATLEPSQPPQRLSPARVGHEGRHRDRGPRLHGTRPAGQGLPPPDRVRNPRHRPAHRTHRIASKARSPSGRRYTTPADVTESPHERDAVGPRSARSVGSPVRRSRAAGGLAGAPPLRRRRHRVSKPKESRS